MTADPLERQAQPQQLAQQLAHLAGRVLQVVVFDPEQQQEPPLEEETGALLVVQEAGLGSSPGSKQAQVQEL